MGCTSGQPALHSPPRALTPRAGVGRQGRRAPDPFASALTALSSQQQQQQKKQKKKKRKQMDCPHAGTSTTALQGRCGQSGLHSCSLSRCQLPIREQSLWLCRCSDDELRR